MVKFKHLSRTIAAVTTAMLFLVITACGGEETTQPPLKQNPIEEEIPAISEEEPNGEMSQGEDADAEESAKGHVQLPATKEFELELEGMKETKTAKLAEGDGYALYIFDIFSFDAETGKLTMNVDNDYYVEITKLPADVDSDELQAQAEKELEEMGNVYIAEDSERNQAMKDASVYMIGEGESLTKLYIVDEIDGQGYIFRVNNPHREPSEGFASHAFTSLSSMVSL